MNRVAGPASGSTFSSWTALQTGLVSGSGVALAARTGEALVAYTRGTTLYTRTSSDNGASWSAETTIVAGGAAIGAYRRFTSNRALPILGEQDFWQRAVVGLRSIGAIVLDLVLPLRSTRKLVEARDTANV